METCVKIAIWSILALYVGIEFTKIKHKRY